MKTLRVFVVCVVLFCVCVMNGCNEEGQVGPSRQADSIYGRTDNVSRGEFQYVTMSGDAITQPGVRMEWTVLSPVYLKPNGSGGYDLADASITEQTIDCNGVTGPGGIMVATGKRDNWDCLHHYVIDCSGAARQPVVDGTGGCQATMDYKTRTIPYGQVAYVSAGGELITYTPPDNSLTGNLSPSEYAALTGPTENAPAHGIGEFQHKAIVQDGGLGNGYSTEYDTFLPINIEDPNQYYRFSAPFSLSSIFKTAAPVNLTGQTFRCTVATNACPDGIEVGLSVIGSNADQQTHVLRTEYFLPVDDRLLSSLVDSFPVYDRWSPLPDANDIWNDDYYYITLKKDWYNFCDPNLIDDPNDLFGIDPEVFVFINRLDTSYPDFEEIQMPDRSMQIQVLPMGKSGDYLYLRFHEQDLSFLTLLIDSWLTDDKNCDLNNDGIVNLADLAMYLSNENEPDSVPLSLPPFAPMPVVSTALPESTTARVPAISADSLDEILLQIDQQITVHPDSDILLLLREALVTIQASVINTDPNDGFSYIGPM